MPERSTSDVRIEINGQQLYKWVRYDIESDILQPSDAFSFTVKNPGGIATDVVRPGDEVQVLVDGTLQMTGVVDDVEGRIDLDGGPTLEIVGRDKMGQLLDESAGLEEINGKNLQQVAELLGAPWVTSWRFENERNRLEMETRKAKLYEIKAIVQRVELETAEIVSNVGDRSESQGEAVATEAFAAINEVHGAALKNARANLAKIRAVLFPRVKVEPGESKLEVIQRLVQAAGLHVWMAADGGGVIARPNYMQRPTFSVQLRTDSDGRTNNVLSGGVKRSLRERYSHYRAVAHSANTRSTKGTGSRHDTTLEDSDCPVTRTLIMAAQGQNREQVRESLERDVAQRKFAALEATYRVRGHTQGGKLWAADTIVAVDDQVHALTAAMYCTRRRFSGSTSGQHTEITLKSKDVWLA